VVCLGGAPCVCSYTVLHTVLCNVLHTVLCNVLYTELYTLCPLHSEGVDQAFIGVCPPLSVCAEGIPTVAAAAGTSLFCLDLRKVSWPGHGQGLCFLGKTPGPWYTAGAPACISFSYRKVSGCWCLGPVAWGLVRGWDIVLLFLFVVLLSQAGTAEASPAVVHEVSFNKEEVNSVSARVHTA